MVELGILIIVAGFGWGFFALRAWQGKVSRGWRPSSGWRSPEVVAAANKAPAPFAAAGAGVLVVSGVVAAAGSVVLAEVAILSGVAIFAVLLLAGGFPARRVTRNMENAGRG
jgi:hypothetical protein